jgi:hypothetical protein
MAAPNLNNITSILGKTARSGISTTNTVGVLTNSSGSNKVLKINSIYAANIDGSVSVDASVGIYNGISTSYLIYTVSVPADSTQIVTTKDTYFYLEEGDEIDVTASSSNRLSIVIGYEEIS